ncbi:hypothetical protein P3S68_012356 [Capsicum galapagoense]
MDGRRMHPKLVMVALSVAVAVAVAVHVVFGDNDFLSRNHFPPSFVFGSASSAYQASHRWKTDSLNPTRFRVELSGIQTRATSRIYNFQVHTMELANGDVDCDAYHKYKEFNHMLHYAMMVEHNVYWILSTCNSWNGSNVKRLLLMVSFLDGLELMDGYESAWIWMTKI